MPIAKNTTSPIVVVDDLKCNASALPFRPHEMAKSERAVYSLPAVSVTTTIKGSNENETGYDVSA